ncbi:chitin-binding domain-containing protein [Pseudomonas orientalis]|uniref:chitin-binding domain-containing protein n=1 Tax=Pseudomonas orientalis TaxID=76758 RepID=UPI003B96966C
MAAGLAVLLAACSSHSGEVVLGEEYPNKDPACTSAGYFKSVSPGWYYRCVYNSSINRWIKYARQCPAGQEFNPAVGRCQ